MRKRSIIYLNVISIFFTVVISHFLTKFTIYKEMERTEIAQEENEPEGKSNEPIIIDRYDETLHKRLAKLEEYVKDNSEITTTIKAAMESEVKKRKTFTNAEDAFKLDLKTYPKDIQKAYTENDKKSYKLMKAKDYKKCAEVKASGLAMLNRREGTVFEIGIERKAYCLFKTKKYDEARVDLEELIRLDSTASFNDGVKLAIKAKVDLYRLCVETKDFNCAESLESDLRSMEKEMYSKDSSVESEINRIKKDK
jgi:tetratricopeptide (TPR) repeat protein